jgi:hypothetical protein
LAEIVKVGPILQSGRTTDGFYAHGAENSTLRQKRVEFGGPLGNAITYLSGRAPGASATPVAIRANSPQAAQPSSYFAGLADATNSDTNHVVLITDAGGGA